MLAIHQNGTSTMSRKRTIPATVNTRAVIVFAVGAPAQGASRRLAWASPAARTTARRSGRSSARSFPVSQEIAADEGDGDDQDGHEEDRDRQATPHAQLVEGDHVR